jgi:predicted lipoprotein with Yx(FWY)xxD motif
MRTMTLLLLATALLSSPIKQAFSAEPTPDKLSHPVAVALHEESPGVWRYRAFPSLMPLYVYDRDEPGKSRCYSGCRSAWPPVRAKSDAEPVGDWTIIERDDGIRQWAYKGRPVYVRYHDKVGAPVGDGQDGTWHLLEP